MTRITQNMISWHSHKRIIFKRFHGIHSRNSTTFLPLNLPDSSPTGKKKRKTKQKKWEISSVGRIFLFSFWPQAQWNDGNANCDGKTKRHKVHNRIDPITTTPPWAIYLLLSSFIHCHSIDISQTDNFSFIEHEKNFFGKRKIIFVVGDETI